MFLGLFATGFFLLLLSTGIESHLFHFINARKNWTEAQSYCRETYTDLATINSTEDMNNILKHFGNATTLNVYIGLNRVDVSNWHWSLPDDSDFHNWKAGQPNLNVNPAGCGAMEPNGQWFEDDCLTQRQFVCFNANDGKYILNAVNKSWQDALEYCRGFYTDIASARNSSENQAVNTAARFQQVWIGLFKDPWVWSDRSNSSYRFWKIGQPNNVMGQDCVAMAINHTGRWNDIKCNNIIPFICQGDLKNQSALSQVTSEVTATFTANSAFSPNQIFTTSSAEPQNNAVTRAEIKTTRPANPDDLMLVRDNLTWSEAVSYCRERYADLVSVFTEELQFRVATLASQASSTHVWLGLRYTCVFSFWFWIRSGEAGCYQNWAPGHGPESLNACGLAGALESSRGHQWAGRPESDRLNFICLT